MKALELNHHNQMIEDLTVETPIAFSASYTDLPQRGHFGPVLPPPPPPVLTAVKASPVGRLLLQQRKFIHYKHV